MVNKVLFSSDNQEWETPQLFYNSLNAKYGPFQLDPCATDDNHKCDFYLTKEENGLTRDWWPFGKIFVNPPYGRNVTGVWVEKAWNESQKGCTVVLLIPARTDNQWFQGYIWDWEKQCTRPGVELNFIPGRLHFSDSEHGAPFPSMVVVFRKV